MSSAVLYLAIVAVWGVVLVPMWLRRDGDGIGRLLHRRAEETLPADLDETAPHVHGDDVGMFHESSPEPEYLTSGRPEAGRWSETGHSEPARPKPGYPDYGRMEPGRPEPGRPEAGSPPTAAGPLPVRRRRVTRGAVIARRRRRTLGLSLLTLTAVVVTAANVAPWWFVFPPAILLAGHLSLLRVAVRMDQARRAEHRRALALRAERLRRAEEEREAREARAAEEAARTAEVIELPGRREEVYDQYTDLRAVGD